MGYDPAWSSPMERLADQLGRARQAAYDAESPDGSQAQQALRLARAAAQLAQETADLALQTAAAVPVTRIQQASNGGYTPTDSWQTVCSLSMPRPDGKSTHAMSATGTVDFDFTTPSTGGELQFPSAQVRIVLNGNVGIASGVRGNYKVLTGAIVIGFAGFGLHVLGGTGGGDVTAEVQVKISWPDGVPASYSFGASSAQVALTTTFTP